jgi:hypothetical protein
MHARREVERRFPVRVRIAVPLAGLGRQLEVMCAWLDATCGTEGWAMAPAGMAGIINDALGFILKTPLLLMPSSRASAAAIGLQRSTMR